METTLNVDIRILEQISRAAESRGVSRSDFIIMLIQKVMDEKWGTLNVGRMVKYQERSPVAAWRTVHLKLREDEYEYFLDLRKVLKMSVSLILAYAVKKYLKQLMNRNSTDNNRFTNYVIVKEYIENIICWRFYWGCPPSIKDYL